MSGQKTINILNGTSDFMGISPNYCDNQDYCKIVEKMAQQISKIIKQNQNLQEQIFWQKTEMEKDNAYLIKLEEANMLLEQEVETLKRQVERCNKNAQKEQK